MHRADDRVAKYSMGMRQRLGVAACLLGDPQLLILDEPMNGLDPAGMREMCDMILSLVAEGRTVVLSSHLLDEVERTCDAVAIVDQGRIIRQGPISELLAGATLDLQVECSQPDQARALIERATLGADLEIAPTGLRSRFRQVRTRCHRRDQPCTGGRRDQRVPAAAGPSVARIMVLAGHEPTRRHPMTLVPETGQQPRPFR